MTREVGCAFRQVVKAKGSSDGYESFKPQSVKPRGDASRCHPCGDAALATWHLGTSAPWQR